MDTIKRCTMCVLPNSLPSLTLDSDGVCNYCRKYTSNFDDVDAIVSEKKKN